MIQTVQISFHHLGEEIYQSDPVDIHVPPKGAKIKAKHPNYVELTFTVTEVEYHYDHPNNILLKVTAEAEEPN